MPNFAEELMAVFGLLIECPNCGTMVRRREATLREVEDPGHSREVQLRCHSCGETWTAMKHRVADGS